MSWLLILVVCVVMVGIGFFGIQRSGNYENKWGMMFWYGLIITVVWLVVGLALVLYGALK